MKSQLLCALICASIVYTATGERIAATLSGYSYASELSYSVVVNETIEWMKGDFVLDTSFASILLLASSNVSEVRGQCLYREVDTSWVVFYSDLAQCPVRTGDLTLGSNGAQDVQYAEASNVTLQNGVLHQWADQEGLLGLGLNGSGPLTPFQQLLQNTSSDMPLSSLLRGHTDTGADMTDMHQGKAYTEQLQGLTTSNSAVQDTVYNTVQDTRYIPTEGSLVFGLDLNPTGEDSYLDMGYESIPQEYRDALQWSPAPPSLNPSTYSLFIDHISLCDQMNLLTNWSTSWAVEIDTGSSCLTLPDEIYDTFTKYLNTTVSYTDDAIPVLPQLSFQMTSFASQGIEEWYRDGTSPTASTGGNLSVFLEQLIVAEDAIIVEHGAPQLFNSHGESAGRLCVLKGSDIHPRGSERFSNPPIVFGALVLQSLYYAADISTGRVGLAQKSDSYAALRSQQEMCVSLEECLGDERFNPASNTCRRPECANYFYSIVDEDSGECSYDPAAVVLGCIMIIGCMVMESWGYLIVQYGYMKDERLDQPALKAAQRQCYSDDDSYPTKPSAAVAYCIMYTLRALDICFRAFMRALLCFTDEIVFAKGYATRAVVPTAEHEDGEGEEGQRQRSRSRSRSSSLANMLSGARTNSSAQNIGGESAVDDAVWGQRVEAYRDPLER